MFQRESIMARGRPPKIKKIEEIVTPVISEPVIEQVIEPKVETKPKISESDIVLVKTNKNIAAQLIENNAKVIHISGPGSFNEPKVWYIEASIKTLDKLSEDDQNLVEKATYSEIDARINKSRVVKEQEKQESAAQKKAPGSAPVASAHY